MKTEALGGAQTCHAVGPDTVVRAARRTSLLPEPAMQACVRGRRPFSTRPLAEPRPVTLLAPGGWPEGSLCVERRCLTLWSDSLEETAPWMKSGCLTTTTLRRGGGS